MSDLLYLRNSNVLEFPEITRYSNGQHITDAVVQVTLLDTDDVAIPGQIWPVNMHYVDGSKSTYRVTLDHALVLPRRVRVHAVADAGGLRGDWKPTFKVIERR